MRTVAPTVVLVATVLVAAQPPGAGAEQGPPLFSLQEEPVVRLVSPEPLLPMPAPSIELELGLAAPPVKRAVPEEGSGPGNPPEARDAEAPEGPPDVVVAAPQPSPPAPPPVPLPALAVYPVVERPEVQHFLERFRTVRRPVIEQWLGRAGRYADMARSVFARLGLPEDLVFTAMIESGFNPVAVSRAGAKGLWQFMAPTARRYGLRVDRWLDERLDPEKATVAAARYLKDLYAMFGSWHLAQAAYNAGEARVQRAIQSAGTDDFWELARTRLLKDETKQFVAAIQAAVLIGREPDRYGFTVAAEPPLRYDVVRAPPGSPLRRLAARGGVPEAELRRLNPQLRLGQTPPDGSYALKVPPGAGPRVAAALGEAPIVRVAGVGAPPPGDVHVVRRRETVESIARIYGVKPGEILRWNGLSGTARIYPGDRLRVASIDVGESEGQGGFR
jgi:membrane-bound lytic murein transglycosylase D